MMKCRLLLGWILCVCETPERSHRSENVTRPYIHKMGKISILGELSLNLLDVFIGGCPVGDKKKKSSLHDHNSTFEENVSGYYLWTGWRLLVDSCPAAHRKRQSATGLTSTASLLLTLAWTISGVSSTLVNFRPLTFWRYFFCIIKKIYNISWISDFRVMWQLEKLDGNTVGLYAVDILIVEVLCSICGMPATPRSNVGNSDSNNP